MSLTTKQSFYLSLINKAHENNQTLRQVAQDNEVNPISLYASVKALRKKGMLPPHGSGQGSSFIKVPVGPPKTPTQRIELKTQLPNGQPLWLSISECQLKNVLRAIGT